MRSLSQRTRIFILAIYVLALFFASRLALGSWVPPTTEKGLWFYSGLAALLLGNLLVTPFYIKPADAISYGVAGIVGLLAVNLWQTQQSGFDRFLWSATALYVLVIVLAGIFSIALKDSPGAARQKLSKSFYLLTDTLGTPRSVFSAVFLFALVAFHRNEPREYLVISLAWALLVGLRPLETLADLLRHWWELWASRRLGEPVGEIVGHQIPGIVLIRHEPDVQVPFGDPLVVRADDGKAGLALTLDHIGFADGLWLRALHLSISDASRTRLATMATLPNPSGALAMRSDFNTAGIPVPTDVAWERRASLVGLVAPDTDVSRLRIEIVRTDLDLAEGCLVEVQIGSSSVLYQVVTGLTREEIIQQKNTRGYVRGDAKKIGRWDVDQLRFEPVKWVPRPNAPVFLVDSRQATPNADAVGHFPGTDYPVTVDVNSLVTHNTAILGILGIGKSFLALELVERMIATGIKVVALDLTNQYADELAQYYNAGAEQTAINDLQTIGREGANNVQRNIEQGGSVDTFKTRVLELLEAFLRQDTREYLRIYNPAQFEVWRQDSRQYPDGNAAMASLTPAEITRIFTEATLQALQGQGMSDSARCCLVFEEAHSLIPEWNAVASEGDKAATNGTAKAILQGRKYGLGCLVITQRTANITKSILNQCNTVFALRIFDATGMEFLKNYIGEDYAAVLSTLEDRHAVVFGRASSCRDPVLVRLNDRADFLGIFRNPIAGEGQAP